MINIYTDGAYSSSRDQGGWAFAILEPRVLKYNGLTATTNNRMEIMGCIKALEYVRDNNITDDVTIFTDSMYVIGTMTKNWKMKKNTDLWPIMFGLMTSKIHFQHVKGHEGDEGNCLCDTWAVFGSHLGGCNVDERIEPTKVIEENIKTNLIFEF